jgi:CO dehydrogenase/acetyl-CoA synthase alpha subunit
MSNNIKELRGQVRIAVKELLPEVLHEQHYEALRKHVDARLNEVEKYIKETMDLMNTRQKEVLKYLIESYLGKPKEETAEEIAAPKTEG